MERECFGSQGSGFDQRICGADFSYDIDFEYAQLIHGF